jgi:hypothetical protein
MAGKKKLKQVSISYVNNKDNDEWCKQCDNHHNKLVSCRTILPTSEEIEKAVMNVLEFLNDN